MKGIEMNSNELKNGSCKISRRTRSQIPQNWRSPDSEWLNQTQVFNMAVQAANLRNIATTGFDVQPLSLSTPQMDHPHGVPEENGSLSSPITNGPLSKPKNMEVISTPSSADHPKLVTNGFHFLKGIDLSMPGLSAELAFADAVAARNNPTTLENIHRKLNMLPADYTSFTKEQQEAFCNLIDSAEMKQALRLELRSKEKLVRDQEMSYLQTDYGLGNVVHGWDITSVPPLGNERQLGSTRIMPRRRIKDSDRIFSASSVKTFVSCARMSKSRRRENKKKLKTQRNNGQLSLQRRGLNPRDEESAESDEESVDGEDDYSGSIKESEIEEDDEEKTRLPKKSHKKKLLTVKKSKKPVDAGKTSQTSKITKIAQSNGPEKGSATGHRLRTLLTNKTPQAGGSGLYGLPSAAETPGGSLKVKFSKKVLIGADLGDIPASPAPSLSVLDSNPGTPGTPNPSGMPKRMRGRPRRLDA